MNLNNVVGGWWLGVGDCITALCYEAVWYLLGDHEQRDNWLSPNHQQPTTNHQLRQAG